MRVLHVASEAVPWIKTGGLADVVGALPLAQREQGVDARFLLPGYPAVLGAMRQARLIARPRVPMAPAPLRLFEAVLEEPVSGDLATATPAFVLDWPEAFDRPGNPYVDEQGRDWADNGPRFAALAYVAALLSLDQLVDGGTGTPVETPWRPHILHAHDWQAGLAPAYLRWLAPTGAQRPVASVMSVHNIAFQGLFPAATMAMLGIPPGAFTSEGVEFYGQLGFLKAGLAFADRLSTVSPSYAREIQGERFGAGLHGLLASRAGALTGIRNGIDTQTWDPQRDPALWQRYGPASLARKAANKQAFQRARGLAPWRSAVLIGVVSRLTHQKGRDLLLAALPALLDGRAGDGGERQGAAAPPLQLALVGSGDRVMEAGFRDLAVHMPESVSVFIGYDEVQAHQIFGACDAIAVPSRFEPCGLTQMYAQRYGAVPVVHRVGGLIDTVTDIGPAPGRDVGTGIGFEGETTIALQNALLRLRALYAEGERWQAVQQAGMARDFSWDKPAQAYSALYRAALDERMASAGRAPNGA